MEDDEDVEVSINNKSENDMVSFKSSKTNTTIAIHQKNEKFSNFQKGFHQIDEENNNDQ